MGTVPSSLREDRTMIRLNTTDYWYLFIVLAVVLFVLVMVARGYAETDFIAGNDGTRGIIYGDGPTKFTWTYNPNTGETKTGIVTQADRPTSLWQESTTQGFVTGDDRVKFYNKADGTSGIILQGPRPAPFCLRLPCQP